MRVTYDEVSEYECWQEDGHTQLVCGAHAVPQGLNPLPAQHTEYHHECMEDVFEVPPANTYCNIYIIDVNCTRNMFQTKIVIR